MFENVFKMFENPNMPLLGPNVKALKFWGLWLPEIIFKRYAYLILYMAFFIFVATEYVDVWFIKDDINLLLNNIKYTLMSTTSICKVTSFLLWQKRWISVIEYVTRADAIQRKSGDIAKKNIITYYTKYCKRFTYLFWSFVCLTSTTAVFIPVFKYFLSANYRENAKNGTEEYIQVLSSWVPFDRSTIPGNLAAIVYQVYGVILSVGLVTSFDTSAIVIMVFLKAELELLRIDSSNIYGIEKETVTDSEAKERLKDVHKRHVELVKFARIFDSCFSPVMMSYLLVCSVVLCATAYQIKIETSALQRVLMAEYPLFIIAQLFIFCWHSNEVMNVSQDLMLGPYESIWHATDVKRRKDLNIMVAQFRKVITLSAGPFVQLNVSTFVSILKGAYSYYTLLSQSQNK